MSDDIELYALKKFGWFRNLFSSCTEGGAYAVMEFYLSLLGYIRVEKEKKSYAFFVKTIIQLCYLQQQEKKKENNTYGLSLIVNQNFHFQTYRFFRSFFSNKFSLIGLFITYFSLPNSFLSDIHSYRQATKKQCKLWYLILFQYILYICIKILSKRKLE